MLKCAPGNRLCLLPQRGLGVRVTNSVTGGRACSALSVVCFQRCNPRGSGFLVGVGVLGRLGRAVRVFGAAGVRFRAVSGSRPRLCVCIVELDIGHGECRKL